MGDYEGCQTTLSADQAVYCRVFLGGTTLYSNIGKQHNTCVCLYLTIQHTNLPHTRTRFPAPFQTHGLLVFLFV